MRVLFPACLALTAWLAMPERGRACTIPAECRGLFVPGEGASVPANAPGFVWVPNDLQPAPSVRFYAPAEGFDATIPVVVEATRIGGVSARLLRLDATLVATREFVLLEEGGCGGAEGAAVHFRASRAAALPSSLGALVASAPRVGDRALASAADCERDTLVAFSEVTVEHSEEAAPWRDLFVYRTEVDGERWAPRASVAQRLPPGTSWVGRGRDVVFAHCGSEPAMLDAGVVEGTHGVQMIAVLPGTDIELATAPVEITLRCAPEPPPPPDPLPPAGDARDASTATSDGGATRRRFTSCSSSTSRDDEDAPTTSVVLTVLLAATLLQRRRRAGRPDRPPSV